MTVEEPPVPPPKGKSKATKARRERADAEAEVEAPVKAVAPKQKRKRSEQAVEAPAPAPTPEAEEEEEEEGDEELPEWKEHLAALEPVLKTYRAETRRMQLPPAAYVADAMNMSPDMAERLLGKKQAALDALRNARQRKKVTGYNKLAVVAGYGNLKTADATDYTGARSAGLDAQSSLLSMADAVRLAKFTPVQPKKASYDPYEYNQRLELGTTSLPVDVARVVVAHAEAVFRGAINEAVALTLERSPQMKVQPVHMYHVLKRYADNMQFTALVPPPGLVEHAKLSGVLPEADGDAARSKRNKTDAVENTKTYKAKQKAIAEAVAKKKKSGANGGASAVEAAA